MKLKKIIAIITSLIIVSSFSYSATATIYDENQRTVNYSAQQDSFAKPDPSMGVAKMTRAAQAFAGKEWIIYRGVGRGCKGWTTVVENGRNKYHYTNAAAYADSAERIAYYSGRVYGNNTVTASTGVVGKGALHHISVFYGW